MKFRLLQQTISTSTVEVAPGLFVRRPLPVKGLRQLSPYLLLDHIGPEKVPAAYKNVVPPHPHRGFMPVTLLFEGQVVHKYSKGNNATLNSGDIGWMIAGKGIVHAESLSNPSQSDAGLFHAVQLWINLPASHKLTAPAYKTIIAETLPVWQQQGAQLRIIAGQYQELKGPAPVYSPILLAHGKFKAGANAFIALPANFEVALYVLEGALKEVENQGLDEGELTIWKKEGEGIQLVAEQDSQFLLLAGEPIQEPLATYGTFVMNRPEELLQAIDDYKSGHMGRL